MSAILDELKKYLLSILTGVVLFPLLQFTQFEGLIYKDAELNKAAKMLTISVFCRKDEVKDIVFTVTFTDTTKITHGNPRMLLNRVPADRAWSLHNCSQFGNTTPGSKSILVTKTVKEKYSLSIPVIIKDSTENFDAENEYSIKFSLLKEGNNIPDIYPDTKKGRWYDWIWFNSLLASGIVLGVVLISQWIYYCKTRKKREP